MADGRIAKWLKNRKVERDLGSFLTAQPEGSRMVVLFEGEQVSQAFEDQHEHITAVSLNHRWRPEGEALSDGVEGIPGYVRPENWRELEAAEDENESRFEVGHGTGN